MKTKTIFKIVSISVLSFGATLSVSGFIAQNIMVEFAGAGIALISVGLSAMSKPKVLIHPWDNPKAWMVAQHQKELEA